MSLHQQIGLIFVTKLHKSRFTAALANADLIESPIKRDPAKVHDAGFFTLLLCVSFR